MKSKHLAYLTFVLLFCYSTSASIGQVISPDQKIKFSVQVDDIPWATGGHSYTFGVSPVPHWSLFLSNYSIKPLGYQVAEGWDLKIRNATSFSALYAFKSNHEGLAVGLTAKNYIARYAYDELPGIQVEEEVVEVGATVSYLLFIPKTNVLLRPHLTFGAPIQKDGRSDIGGLTYEPPLPFEFFASLSIGYEFGR